MEQPLRARFANWPLPWVLGLSAAGLLLVGLIGYRFTHTSNPQTDLSKLTVTASKQTLPVAIKANGTVEPIQSVNIGPKAPGRLISLLVEQGVLVKQGQLLAIMDNRELQAQYLQAQSQLNQAQAKLEEAKVSIPSEVQQAKIRVQEANNKVDQAQAMLKEAQMRIPRQVDQAKAQLTQAETRLKLAQARAKRNEYLVSEGAITKDQYDSITSELSTAQANLSDLKQRLEQVQATSYPEIDQLKHSLEQAKSLVDEAQAAYVQKQQSAKSQLLQLQAAVKAAQGQAQLISVQSQDTRITAPFAGIITQRYAEIGAFVTPSTSVSSSTDDSAPKTSILALAKGLQIRAKVPEVDIGQLSTGQKVKITADAYPNQDFEGKIVRIAPEAVKEQNVTSFDVIIALVTGQDKLRSKMNVDMIFLGKSISNALVVPTVSIVTQGGKTGVMVPNQKREPEFKPVKIGTVIDDKTQILSGITSGDRVFIDLPQSQNKKDKK
jgi:HlyD family secretion protein